MIKVENILTMRAKDTTFDRHNCIYFRCYNFFSSHFHFLGLLVTENKGCLCALAGNTKTCPSVDRLLPTPGQGV